MNRNRLIVPVFGATLALLGACRDNDADEVNGVDIDERPAPVMGLDNEAELDRHNEVLLPQGAGAYQDETDEALNRSANGVVEMEEEEIQIID